MESKNLKICLKVNEKWVNKYVEIDGLTSDQVIGKIIQSFGLSSNLFYHLYYKDDQDQIISVSAKEINAALKQNRTRKYYLQSTQNKLNHWGAIDQNQTKCDQNFVKGCIDKTKQDLIRQLASFGKKLQEEIKAQIQTKTQRIQSKLLCKTDKKPINSDLYCQGSCLNNSFIIGYRFQCLICPNFNLCQKCESSNHYKHNENHPLIKIINQEQSLLVLNRKVLKKNENNKTDFKVPKKRVDSQKHFKEVTGASSEAYEHLRSKYRLATVNELINFYYEQSK